MDSEPSIGSPALMWNVGAISAIKYRNKITPPTQNAHSTPTILAVVDHGKENAALDDYSVADADMPSHDSVGKTYKKGNLNRKLKIVVLVNIFLFIIAIGGLYGAITGWPEKKAPATGNQKRDVILQDYTNEFVENELIIYMCCNNSTVTDIMVDYNLKCDSSRSGFEKIDNKYCFKCLLLS